MLLWLWPRPAAPALIQPLDWESPYAMGEALKRQKTHKKWIAEESIRDGYIMVIWNNGNKLNLQV